eukprot:gene15349-20680_t
MSEKIVVKNNAPNWPAMVSSTSSVNLMNAKKFKETMNQSTNNYNGAHTHAASSLWLSKKYKNEHENSDGTIKRNESNPGLLSSKSPIFASKTKLPPTYFDNVISVSFDRALLSLVNVS